MAVDRCRAHDLLKPLCRYEGRGGSDRDRDGRVEGRRRGQGRKRQGAQAESARRRAYCFKCHLSAVGRGKGKVICTVAYLVPAVLKQLLLRRLGVRKLDTGLDLIVCPRDHLCHTNRAGYSSEGDLLAFLSGDVEHCRSRFHK